MEMKDLFEKTGIYSSIRFDLTIEDQREELLSFFDFTKRRDGAIVLGREAKGKRVYLNCLHCQKENSFETAINDNYNKFMFLNGYGNLSMKGISFGAPMTGTTHRSKSDISLDNKDNKDSYSNSTSRFLFHYNFACSHNEEHKYFLDLEITQSKNIVILRKVGQLPSPYELMHENRYDDVLNDLESLEDYRKSIETTAYNYHVASFMYSRRVLERIMLKKFLGLGNTKKEFKKIINFEEKFKLTKEIIEPELRDHFKPLYGVLSEGIHNLTDEECREYYTILHDLVKFQLEYMLIEKERETHKQKTINKLQKITSKLKKK
jgi:hypothetical protein